MRHTYRSATDVIAWIGEDNGPQDERGVAFLQQLRVRTGCTGDWPRGLVKATAKLELETFLWLLSTAPSGFFTSPWFDLLWIFERPWFSRIWTVHEVVMGRSVGVWCGCHGIEWMDICYCAVFVLRHATDALRNLAKLDTLDSHDLQGLGLRICHWQRLIAAAKKIHVVGLFTS